VSAQNRDLTAVLHLPVAACRSGRKRAYSGPHAERFNVVLVTDDAATVEPLRERLRQRGFTHLEVEVRPSLLDGGPGDDSVFLPGFAIAWDGAAREPSIAEFLRRTVQEEMERVGARDFMLRTTGEVFLNDEAAVRIFFPMRGLADGKLLLAVGDPS